MTLIVPKRGAPVVQFRLAADVLARLKWSPGMLLVARIGAQEHAGSLRLEPGAAGRKLAKTIGCALLQLAAWRRLSARKQRATACAWAAVNGGLELMLPDWAVPTDAVPTDAVPNDAVPTDAVPTDAVPNDAALIARHLATKGITHCPPAYAATSTGGPGDGNAGALPLPADTASPYFRQAGAKGGAAKARNRRAGGPQPSTLKPRSGLSRTRGPHGEPVEL